MAPTSGVVTERMDPKISVVTDGIGVPALSILKLVGVKSPVFGALKLGSRLKLC
jgi:hypothetical protein